MYPLVDDQEKPKKKSKNPTVEIEQVEEYPEFPNSPSYTITDEDLACIPTEYKGQQSTNKYVRDRVRAILEAISHGVPYKYAAQIGGISDRTFGNWREQHPEFDALVRKADGDFILYHLKIIAKAAPSDWRASRDILKMRFPEHFSEHDKGQRLRVQIEGRIEHDHELTAKDLQKALNKYAGAIENALEAGRAIDGDADDVVDGEIVEDGSPKSLYPARTDDEAS